MDPLLIKHMLTDIADIDNTIKETETGLLDTLQSTLIKHPSPVQDMLELYKHINSILLPTWFYLTANPFLRKSSIEYYPAGALIKRYMSLWSLTGLVLSLLSDSFVGIRSYKEAQLEEISQQNPEKFLILISDSMQEDPEAYVAQ